MILDCHVHMDPADHSREAYYNGMKQAGIDGGLIFSPHPASFSEGEPTAPWQERLQAVLDFAGENVYPLYWIDPTEDTAAQQVDAAVKAGIAGFKCICSHFFPCDSRAMRVWNKIAETGKPVMFHSGILYGGGDSSQYNRPVGFEGLIFIPNFKFAIAHVSWPWCDECLAVYGKWNYYHGEGLISSQMFIDTTRGTPDIYREEALRKLYTIGYDIEDNIIFGTDMKEHYNAQAAAAHVKKDIAIFDKLGIPQETREKYFHKNLLRFLGK